MTQNDNGPGVAPLSARLYRSRTDKILGGVAGGLGKYFGIDPVWFRLGFVVLTLAGAAGIFVYIVSWVIIPEEPAEGAPVGVARNLGPQASLVGGLALVALGVMLLIRQLFPWIGELFWPTVLVVAGLGLVVMGLRRDRS
ncbi:MAG: PspC domain-containing protein [Actinomycetes bacterium]|jgi:phage shock protein C|nr:MAG: PspC domain-containing protein [Actinomycetota bacterium]